MMKNKLLKYKKAFAFSFLAIFLSFLIFAYGSLFLFKGDFSKQNNFDDSRISNLNDEIKYFKNTYSNNFLSFVFYNTMFSINDNKSNFKLFENNYSALNNLILEGMNNGSFNGTSQINLENKTVKFFFKDYQKTFNKNNLANISFKIKSLNLFEKNPYYISIQILAEYNITTIDNISSWDFTETKFISVPIYNFKDPKFTQLTEFNFTIRPMELYIANINWSLKLFNETMDNVYSTVYFEPNHKYTIGSSYIENLLNISRSSYKDVLGFYSFDYDEENPPFVFDSTFYSPQIRHFGNTRLLLNFENSTIKGLNISDLSAYNNSGILFGGVNCTINGSFGKACKFDGINDGINISKNKLNLNNTNLITITAWINPNSNLNNPEIFKYGGGFSDVLDLRLLSNNKVMMEVGSHNGGIFKQFISLTNISLNNWTQVVASFDGNSGISKLYINGKIDSIGNSLPIINFKKSTPDIIIGMGVGGLVEQFNGSIDELAIYSKVLSDSEVAKLYGSKKAEFIDYKNALYGRGIEFDGIDDYINLDNLTNQSDIYDDQIDIRSGEFWFKTYNKSKMQVIYKEGRNTNGINLYINNSKIFFGAYSKTLGWNGEWISNPIKENQWNLVTYVFDSVNTKSMKLYLNGEIMNSSNIPLIKPISMGHTGADSIGSMIGGSIFEGNPNLGNRFYFKGLIDEVKIYNRSLSSDEVLENYYNYASFSKGCCNYISLINPNLMNFNNSFYKKNISYSSKVFFDHFKRGKPIPKMVVYNATNITSQITTKNYFNFLVDACIIESYGISQITDINIIGGVVNNANTCSELISSGFY